MSRVGVFASTPDCELLIYRQQAGARNWTRSVSLIEHTAMPSLLESIQGERAPRQDAIWFDQVQAVELSPPPALLYHQLVDVLRLVAFRQYAVALLLIEVMLLPLLNCTGLPPVGVAVPLVDEVGAVPVIATGVYD